MFSAWNGRWCTLVCDFIASVSLDVHSLILHLNAVTLPAHSSYTWYWDSIKNVGRFFSGIFGIFLERVFFFRFFLRVVRHLADSVGRPTDGAQVLVRVSMVPWHPYHSGPARATLQSAASR